MTDSRTKGFLLWLLCALLQSGIFLLYWDGSKESAKSIITENFLLFILIYGAFIYGLVLMLKYALFEYETSEEYCTKSQLNIKEQIKMVFQ